MFVLALVIAIISTTIGLVASGFRYKGVAAATFVLTFLANWGLFWFTTPTFSGANMLEVLVLNTFLPAVCYGLAAFATEEESLFRPVAVYVVALVLPVLIGFGWHFLPTGQDGADKLAKQVSVIQADPAQYPETDANHMVIVGAASAERKANQALSNNGNINTYYDLGKGNLQSVGGRMYYVYELKLTGMRNQKRMDYTVPGFVVVDAEDPNAASQLRTTDASGQPYKLRYVTDMPWEYSVDRLLWNNGYRSYFVDDRTFEVTDQWQPFYTASINKPALRWMRAVPEGFITINPATGSITRYGLDRVPQWVDRVYSAQVVKDMMNWHGQWGAGKDKAPYKLFAEGSGNRFKVSGEPELVYTKGGHPAWQVLMTSYKSDTAVNNIALFDARSNKVTLYSVPDGMTVEQTVADAIMGSPENPNKQRIPAALALHKIYGRLTWAASLEPNTEDARKSFNGVALVPATNVNNTNVRIGNTKAEALDKYRSFIATTPSNNSPEENSQTRSITGKVTQLKEVVSGGQTFVYFLIGDDTAHVYKSRVDDAQPELTLIRVGTTVTVGYLETGVDSSRREVRSYDDLSLALK